MEADNTVAPVSVATAVAYTVPTQLLEKIIRALEQLRARLAQQGIILEYRITQRDSTPVIEITGDPEAVDAAAQLLEKLGATPA